MKSFCLLRFLFVFVAAFCGIEAVAQEHPAQTPQQIRQPEAYSLFKVPLYPIAIAPEEKAKLDSNLAAAQAAYEKDPNDPERIIWLGRRLAYLWRYREAVEVYSKGIALHPNYAKLYRHRGHRYITIREFDKAIVDLEQAAKLIQRAPDEIEPDGAPNPYNIPTSTSHSNIWYHHCHARVWRGELVFL